MATASRSRSISSRQRTNLVDYFVMVPTDAVVSLRSSDGTLRVQGLAGDIVMESGTSSVEATDVRDAHLHVKSLSGPINLVDIRNSHLDIHSVSGNINMRNVIGSSVEVSSGSGRITYEGDPGPAGEYRLTSHSGDLEVSIPASALVEIRAHSMKAESNQGLSNAGGVPAMGQRKLLLKPGIVSASRFVLRSFRGKIYLKRP